MSPPLVCQRHANFIGKRLAITAGALAVAPFFVAFHGAPTGTETCVFACSFAPLAAAVLLARTGRLAAAHGVAFLGLVALSLSLWLGLGCGAGCAIAWLITAQLEAMLAGDKRLSLWAGLLTGTVLLGIFAAILEGAPAASSTTAATEAFAGLALAYAIVVAAGSWHAAEVRTVAPRPSRQNDRWEHTIGTRDSEIWRAVSGLLDDMVVECDAVGSIVRLPTNHDTQHGIAASDLMGRGLFEHIHVADRPAFLKQIADTAHGADATPSKIRLRTSDAPPRHIRVEMRTRRIATPADPNSRDVVAVLREIDAVHEPALPVAGPLHAMDDIGSKDHFLANMSHELRTPLNAIIGFSEMLASRTLRPNDADKQREYARIVHQSGQHLLSVVNAILDMSKIRSGTFTLAPGPFDVIPLLGLCCDMVALKAAEGGVHIVRDFSERMDEIVGDARACKQILINLLSNAVKFTPEHGQVTLSARREGQSLVMSVSDTGIGISAADLSRLGDPFFQASASFSRPFEGTGLGLSMVRGLVGLHGGTIALESEIGHGTRVIVRLPLDCRPFTGKTTPATIDPIAHHPTPEPLFSQTDLRLGRTDQRMKKIA